MPAYAFEIDEARPEGVHFAWRSLPFVGSGRGEFGDRMRRRTARATGATTVGVGRSPLQEANSCFEPTP